MERGFPNPIAEDMTMASLSKCFRCGSPDLEEREVEHLVRGGQHVALLCATATVCHHCGERFFDMETMKRFEHSRKELEREELDSYRAIGQMLRPAAV